jgi:hypothetical protein
MSLLHRFSKPMSIQSWSRVHTSSPTIAALRTMLR